MSESAVYPINPPAAHRIASEAEALRVAEHIAASGRGRAAPQADIASAAEAGITGILNQDMADVEALGVGQTPTFFLNGTRLENFSAESLVAAVRSAVENA